MPLSAEVPTWATGLGFMLGAAAWYFFDKMIKSHKSGNGHGRKNGYQDQIDELDRRIESERLVRRQLQKDVDEIKFNLKTVLKRLGPI